MSISVSVSASSLIPLSVVSAGVASCVVSSSINNVPSLKISPAAAASNCSTNAPKLSMIEPSKSARELTAKLSFNASIISPLLNSGLLTASKISFSPSVVAETPNAVFKANISSGLLFFISPAILSKETSYLCPFSTKNSLIVSSSFAREKVYLSAPKK
ncbi:hypothetical protein [Halarcobacter sp.]|uniref:hypothetical protein n=1 Tax=Halarcobacter sp. TaxID=2321133 RepID=UPI002AAC247A|nr:hypothetical protein [Halarcobacter sp.]